MRATFTNGNVSLFMRSGKKTAALLALATRLRHRFPNSMYTYLCSNLVFESFHVAAQQLAAPTMAS
jgi:hypothetical protein